MDGSLALWLLLVGVLFSIICHGHSQKILRASSPSSLLACLTMVLTLNDQDPGGFYGVLFLPGLAVYFVLSLIIGLLYTMTRDGLVDLDGLIERKGQKSTTGEQAGFYSLRTVFWKICFWIIFELKAEEYISTFREGKLNETLNISDLSITILAIIGFFLYAYRKKVGVPIFWRIFSLFFIGWDISLNCLIRGYQEGEWIGFLVFFPMYLALILYGFFYFRNDLSKMEQSPT